MYYYPFHDHNPPPFELIKFCDDVDAYLHQNHKNIVAIHCKAGKGRTGTLIAILLLYLKKVATTKEALTLFGNARTSNGQGVTIPSQQRYIKYSELWMKHYFWSNNICTYQANYLHIKQIILNTSLIKDCILKLKSLNIMI